MQSERPSSRHLLQATLVKAVALFADAPGPTLALDPQGRVLAFNAAARVLIGGTGDLSSGLPLAEWVSPGSARVLLREVRNALGGTPRTTEMTLLSHTGEPVVLLMTLSPVMSGARNIGVLVSAMDITRRVQRETWLAHRYLHDPVTELPNADAFHSWATAALERNPPGQVALLLVDLDDFKNVVQASGHQFGDSLLHQVGRRLRSLTSASFVAHLASDQFAVLAEGFGTPHIPIMLAETVEDLVRRPFLVGENEVLITCSIGVATSAPELLTPFGLLEGAEIALLRAKRMGKARWQAFTSEPRVNHGGGSAWIHELRQALRRNQFRLDYQPIVCLETRTILGLEALLRWDHPRLGPINPGGFIPIAEESGLIVPIGKWVLERACSQLQQWTAAIPESAGLFLNVNVSARQLQDANLITDLQEVLSFTGLEPSRLQLEVTESEVLNDPATRATMVALKELGVRLALDDFGTGYSSLSSLKQLPLDTLKLDRAFVSGVDQTAADMAVIKAALDIAAALNLAVTAEGVETAEQAQLLYQLGYRQAQGYLFHNPASSEVISQLLKNSVDTHTPLEISAKVGELVDRTAMSQAPSGEATGTVPGSYSWHRPFWYWVEHSWPHWQLVHLRVSPVMFEVGLGPISLCVYWRSKRQGSIIEL